MAFAYKKVSVNAWIPNEKFDALGRRGRGETAGAEVERLRLGAWRPVDDRSVDDARRLRLATAGRRAERMHATFDAPAIPLLRRSAAAPTRAESRSRRPCLPRAAALPLALGAHPALRR